MLTSMNYRWLADSNLRRINWLLLSVIIILNSYTLLMPLLPQLGYMVATSITKPVKASSKKPSTLAAIDRSYNHIVIPSIQLDEPFFEGTDPHTTLDRGPWLRPQGSTPSKGGNTVIAGHRFTYDTSAVFYNLDKLQSGDEIFIVYGKTLYRYVMSTSVVVPPTAVNIEEQTPNDQLTLYTCTPLLTASDRLVITAPLKEKYL